MMKKHDLEFGKVLALFLIIWILSGCQVLCGGWKNKKLNSITIHYPADWKIKELSAAEENQYQLWEILIPGYESYIEISSQMALDKDGEELRILIHETMVDMVSMNIIDNSTLIVEPVMICGYEYDLYKYYRPERYEDDMGQIPAMDVVEVDFLHDGYIYGLSLNLGMGEEIKHETIEEQFYQLLKRMECH
jgi:hypothetical protein